VNFTGNFGWDLGLFDIFFYQLGVKGSDGSGQKFLPGLGEFFVAQVGLAIYGFGLENSP